ncbi:hypothetical protein [Plebeiibacterium marinum]|uniref:Uncharacterized protein n=1 Tax=Plebeiibacterium marinum TaxID=2992111 RepID=A0AAE3MEB4_9BACT|nr:hypothetical protein [Plebeiobacterium marinum]MCW3806031.1 hypothetical protein [Plebeiobacterium marinum]
MITIIRKIGSWFLQLGNLCYRLQGTFPGWGNLAASCSNTYISELRIFEKYCIYNKTDSGYIK